MAPLSVNPALTGNFEGRLRVNANYRNQWAQLLEANSYRTGQLSLDTKKNNTMKNIVIFSTALIFIIFSCQKDKNQISATDFIRGLFPSEYQSNQDIYFVNALNEQKRLICFYEEKEYSSTIAGVSSDVKQFSTLFYEENELNPLVVFTATNDTNHEDIDDYTLRFKLNPFGNENEGFCSFILPFRDGNFSNLVTSEFYTEHNFEFSEIVFHDIYYNTNENSQGFSQLFYNVDYGIVAFRDQTDDLWVYSHAEEK